jgi:GntR family transcriptional regulator
VPIYSQVIDQVKHAIAIDELTTGDQLPTVRQLATELEVNFNTIARAYRALDKEGIIYTQHGRGTFIIEPRSERRSEPLCRQGLETLAEKFLVEARKLGFPAGELQDMITGLLKNRK